MNGQTLKKKLQTKNISFADLAEKLGIAAQSLNSCFKVQDVGSNRIEQIAQVLELPMSFFYPSEGNNAVASGNNSVAAIQSTVTQGDNKVLQERINGLQKLLQEKENLLNEKERTIQILMKK